MRELGARLATALGWLPVRIAITAGLLALVASSIDWSTLGDAVSDTSWGLVVAAVVAVLASFGVGGIRWHALLTGARLDVDTPRALRVYVVGAFSNNFLPTGFGGDAVRAVLIARPGPRLVRALVSVLTDRASALACGLALAWIGFAVDPGAIPGELVALLGAATGAGVAAVALALALAGRGRVASFLPEVLRRWGAEVLAVLRDYVRDRELLVRLVVYGLAYQGLVVLALWLLSEAIGAGVSAPVLAVVTPLVLIATLAPITIAGFGVREGAFVVLLGEVGVSSADATLLSLLSVAVIATASLPGAAALIAGDLRPPSHDEIEATLAATEAGAANGGSNPDAGAGG